MLQINLHAVSREKGSLLTFQLIWNIISFLSSGVRRGRYSIAIRTQAILEAKAREAETIVTDFVPVKKQRLDSPEYVSESSPDSGLCLDSFDGLLDLGERFQLNCDNWYIDTKCFMKYSS